MPLPSLAHRLAAAADVTAAAAACCDTLAELSDVLPSVYLERSGRLRCMASRGYWQVLDGFPPETGMLATTYLTGVARIVQADDAHFLKALPGITMGAAVPIRIDGRTVGAVNAETMQRLPSGILDVLEEVAKAFAARLAALGGLEQPAGWRLLADRAVMLAELRSPSEVQREVIEIGCRLMGTSSGLLAITAADDSHEVAVVRGPLTAALHDLSHQGLHEIASWVAAPLSCYSLGSPDGYGFSDYDDLRLKGVQRLVVTSLRARGQRLGFLLLADDRSAVPTTAQVEQVELLATLAAQALATVHLVAELEDRAERDPLTGLGHAAAFAKALSRPRDPALRATAVLVLDADGFKQVNDTRGHLEGDRFLRALASALSAALRQDDHLYRIGGDEFAAILEIGATDEVANVADRLLQAAHDVDASVSIGIALGRTESAAARSSVLTAADAALYRVKERGGDGYAVSGADEPPADAPPATSTARSPADRGKDDQLVESDAHRLERFDAVIGASPRPAVERRS